MKSSVLYLTEAQKLLPINRYDMCGYRYHKSVAIKQKDGCYLAQDHLTNEGYVRIKIHRKSILVHRLIYTIIHGEIPKGMIIRHLCNNPSCINPKHLEIGTDKDNAGDRERSLPKEFIRRRTQQLLDNHKKWKDTH